MEDGSMSTTVVSKKRRVTLPMDICEAAGLRVNDEVEWRFEGGEIRGHKLAPPDATKEAFPPGSLLEYFTPERGREELAILSGCVQGPE
jgi:bifunctional DNA-binding transcriptional regulator/antitoxin component of YhaV-PrlF toxin-antitoxin module